MISPIIFYLISGLLIFSALMVVTRRNLFTCALYLAAALSLIAFFFIFLNADFLAAVQILLYVGGVLVVMAFSVMLSSIAQDQLQAQVNEQWFPSLIASLAIIFIFLIGIRNTPFLERPAQSIEGTTQLLGHLLLGAMALPFETISLILLASLIGAVYFSKLEKK